MCNPGEIKGFCSKSGYLRPSSNLFVNVMQKPGADLPYGSRVPGAPLSDGKIFLVFTFIWPEDFAKVSEVPGAPRNIIPARSITWLISENIHSTIFQ